MSQKQYLLTEKFCTRQQNVANNYTIEISTIFQDWQNDLFTEAQEKADSTQITNFLEGDLTSKEYLSSVRNSINGYHLMLLVSVCVLVLVGVLQFVPSFCGPLKRKMKNNEYTRNQRACPMIIYLVSTISLLVFFLWSMILSVQISHSYDNMLCQVAVFSDTLLYGTQWEGEAIAQYVGVYNISDKLDVFNEYSLKFKNLFMETLDQDTMDELSENLKELDTSFQELEGFKDTTVNTFQAEHVDGEYVTEYPLYNFSYGYYYPTHMQGTVLHKVDKQMKNWATDQLNLIQGMESKASIVEESDFTTTLSNIYLYSETLYEDSRLNQDFMMDNLENIQKQTASVNHLELIYVVTAIGLVTGIFYMKFYFDLKEAKKSTGFHHRLLHLSYICPGAALLFISVAQLAVYSQTQVSSEMCLVIDDDNLQHNLPKYEKLLNLGISQYVTDCLFNETDDSKNFIVQAKDYVDAFDIVLENSVAYNKIEVNKKMRHVQDLYDKFFSSEKPQDWVFGEDAEVSTVVTQPAEQLVNINRRTNVNDESSQQMVCMTGQDQIVDNYQECFRDYKAQYDRICVFGNKCCINIDEEEVSFFEDRYGKKYQNCKKATQAISAYKTFELDLFEYETGIIPRAQEAIETLSYNLNKTQNTLKPIEPQMVELSALSKTIIDESSQKYGISFDEATNCQPLQPIFENIKTATCTDSNPQLLLLLNMNVLNQCFLILLVLLGAYFSLISPPDIDQQSEDSNQEVQRTQRTVLIKRDSEVNRSFSEQFERQRNSKKNKGNYQNSRDQRGKNSNALVDDDEGYGNVSLNK